MHYSQYFNIPYYNQKFIRSLKRHHYSEETIIAYTKDLKIFTEFMYNEYDGYILVEDILRNDLLDYLTYLQETKGYKKTSMYRHLSTLKSFYRFLVNEMGFKENIASKIPHKSVFVPLPPILTQEEVKNLLNAAKEYSFYFYILIAMLYYTGGRITATIQLEKKNVDLIDKKVYFPKIKGGKDLYLPLNEKLVRILEEFLKNHPASAYPYVFHSPRNPTRYIDAQTVRFHLKKIKEIAKIDKRVTPHVLRHTMATHLTLEGVEQRFLMEILGHDDPRSTVRYQQLLLDSLREPINKLT